MYPRMAEKIHGFKQSTELTDPTAMTYPLVIKHSELENHIN